MKSQPVANALYLLADALAVEPRVPAPAWPEAPTIVGNIEGERIVELMHDQFGIITHCEDREWGVVSEEDICRFLKWYKDPFDYGADDYDCGNYAIQLLADYDKWTYGLANKGFIWAWRNEDDELWPSFGAHAFNFFILPDERIMFADELRVAAPKDELWEAYPLTHVMLSVCI